MRKLTLGIMALMMSVACIGAETVKIGDIWYKLYSDDYTAIVLGPQNSETYADIVTLVLPDSVFYNDRVYAVLSVEGNAFGKCSKLDTVIWNIRNCTRTYYTNEHPFYNSTRITQFRYIRFGEGVITIPEYVCYDQYQLEKAIISSTVTTIRRNAFYECSKLAEIQLPDGLTGMYTSAFGYCTQLTAIQLPLSLKKINDYVFIGCTSLKTIDLHEGITSIGEEAFKNTAITTITIPSTVTSISDAAFQNCTKLDSVVWNAVSATCGYATNTWPFYQCKNVRSFTFGENVKSIPTMTCYELSALQKVYNYAFTPQTINANVFKYVDKANCTLYVPIEYIDLYQTADVWKEFNPIIGMSVGLHFDEQAVPVTYLKSDSSLYHMDLQTWQVPVAPRIQGFNFLKWEVQKGDLADGILLRAVYETDQPTEMPAIYTNPANPAQKLIREGKVYILRDEKTYTIQGQIVK